MLVIGKPRQELKPKTTKRNHRNETSESYDVCFDRFVLFACFGGFSRFGRLRFGLFVGFGDFGLVVSVASLFLVVSSLLFCHYDVNSQITFLVIF